jgi:hypothetical protein
MIPKSGFRFSEKITLYQKAGSWRFEQCGQLWTIPATAA